MRANGISILGLVALGVSSVALADPPKEVMTITRPGDVKFKPSVVLPGIESSVMVGDAKTPGQPYVVQIRFAPGTFTPPHFHPEARYITVLKGTWWVGAGPILDKDKSFPVPAGSTVVNHANQIHWDGAKDEEAIVQVIGIGPSGTITVDESGKPKGKN